jgi:sugar lactone lactonase YvrE
MEFTRRNLTAAAGATAATTFTRTALGGWEPSERYPDPAIQIVDPSSANVCFGGVKRNRLFMAASHSVYSLFVNTQGAPGG